MKKLMRYLALSMMFCLIFLPATKVRAAGLSVTGYTTNEITVHWDSVDNNQAIQNARTYQPTIFRSDLSQYVKYVIGCGGDENGANSNCNTDVSDKNYYTFSGLNGGSRYYITVKYYVVQPAQKDPLDKTGKTITKEATTTPQTIGTVSQITKPNTPSNVRTTFWSLGQDKLVVEWDMDGNYTGFDVQYKDSEYDLRKKTVNEKKITLNTEFTKYYKIAVRAYIDIDGKREYGDLSDELYTFAQPNINETDDGYDIKIKSGKMKISWEKIGQATGYEIYVGTRKNGPYKKVKTIKNKDKTSASFKYNGKKFNPKKEYFVYVVSVRTKNGKTTRSSASQVFNYRKGDTYMTLRSKS